MEVRSLIKKGADHLVYCEDDLLLCKISETKAVFGVFDGCSTGEKSHFASSLYSKLFRKSVEDNIEYAKKESDLNKLSEVIWHGFLGKAWTVGILLDLNEIELLSTAIIAIVDSNKVNISVCGDGGYFIDGQEFKIESVNNEPDYAAYHLNDAFADFYSTNVIKNEFNFSDFSICTDGIYSFKHNQSAPNVEEDVVKSLIIDDKFKANPIMLAKKYNILKNNGYTNTDDLTIIRVFHD